MRTAKSVILFGDDKDPKRPINSKRQAEYTKEPQHSREEWMENPQETSIIVNYNAQKKMGGHEFLKLENLLTLFIMLEVN